MVFLRLRVLRSVGSFRSVVEGVGVWIWGSWAALTRGEDELRRCGGVALLDDHVAAGAVEQFGQNLSGLSWSIVSEDALIGDAAADLHTGVAGDLAKDLIEARVVR